MVGNRIHASTSMMCTSVLNINNTYLRLQPHTTVISELYTIISNRHITTHFVFHSRLCTKHFPQSHFARVSQPTVFHPLSYVHWWVDTNVSEKHTAPSSGLNMSAKEIRLTMSYICFASSYLILFK